MNEIKEKFIELYRYALNDDKKLNSLTQWTQISAGETEKILRLAEKQNVLPMVVNAIYSESAGFHEKTLNKYITKAIKFTCDQAKRTAEFLNLYRYLTKNNVYPVISGGLICRLLYKEPEHLITPYEVLLMLPDQLDLVRRLLVEYGMKYDASETSEKDNLSVTYFSDLLKVALHTYNNPKGFVSDHCESQLSNEIEINNITEMVCGIPVRTLSYTDQLLYLINSAYSDQNANNLTIRSVSDIVLFSIKYFDSITWEIITHQCKEAQIFEFVSSVYSIGESYLFPCDFMDQLKDLWRTDHSDKDNLLESILSENIQPIQNITLPKDNKTGAFKRLNKWSHHSFLSAVLSPLYMIISWIEYHILNLIGFIKGDRMPSEYEQSFVRENVTFIIKSFERQNLVKELCSNIKNYYPGTSVIIADDSSKPLSLIQENVKVIQLPFNSGLSAGLKAALEEVKTPYVMRMDDDELLMVRTKVHRELKYLMDHPDLDLIGFGHTTAIKCHSPEYNFKEYFKCPMDDAPLPLKIPHMTEIDANHIVLGKVANIYLAKTEKIREVGFDPNIRIIDHHEFFWRAAGVITSAIALDTMVFHRHNPYLKKYNSYRSDFASDLKYINRKRRRMNWEVRNEKHDQ